MKTRRISADDSPVNHEGRRRGVAAGADDPSPRGARPVEPKDDKLSASFKLQGRAVVVLIKALVEEMERKPRD